jgi:4-hydroxy-4-methyl-2-oxoglutarate aldolase
MSHDSVNRRRRNLLASGASIIGAAAGGALLPARAEAKPRKFAAGEGGRYLKYDDKLSKMFTAVLQDVMDAMNVRDRCMEPNIKPVLPTMRAWGEAVTIYMEEVHEIPKKPFQMEMDLLDSTKPGQLIVAECNAKKMSAFWGGLLSNAAVGHGVTGVVVDGGVRDYDEICELKFPVFSAGMTPYDSLGRMDGRDTNIPVVCGGVKVSPGDLVFADVVGVVVVPQQMVDEVIAKAWQKVQGESTVRKELRNGAGVTDTFRKYGVL